MPNYSKLAGLIVAGATAIVGTTVVAVKKRKSVKKEENKNATTTFTVSSDTTPPSAPTVKPMSQTNQEPKNNSVEEYVKAENYDPGSVPVEDDLV